MSKSKPMFRLKKRFAIATDRDTGLRFMIFRPRDETMRRMKLALGNVALDHQSSRFLDQALTDSGDHVFVGYAAMGTDAIVDEMGLEIDRAKPGDSYVTMELEVMPVLGDVVEFRKGAIAIKKGS